MVPNGTERQYIVRAPRPAETWRGCALRRLFQHGGSTAVRAGQNVAQPLNAGSAITNSHSEEAATEGAVAEEAVAQ